MKKHLTLLFALSLLFSQRLIAQGWEYVLPDSGIVSYGQQLIPTSDGNYLFSGFQSGVVSDSFGSYVAKLTEEGDLLWRKNYPNNSGGTHTLTELTGNRYLHGTPTINLATKFRVLDDLGNVIAEKDVTKLIDGIRQKQVVIPQANGGFIYAISSENTTDLYHFDGNYDPVFYDSLNITTATASTSTGPLYSQLSNGNLIWLTWNATSILIEETDEFGASIQSQSIPWTEPIRHLNYDDGAISFVSTNSTFDSAVSELIRFDASLSLISRDTIWDGVYFEPRAVVKDSDGYYISGFTGVNPDPTGGTGVIIKTDLDGTVLFTHIATNRPGASIFKRIIPSQTQGCIAIGDYERDNVPLGYKIKLDSSGVLYTNSVSGHIAVDDNPDCLFTPGETPVNNWMVTAYKNGAFFGAAISDEFGAYSISLDTGNFVISAIPANNYWNFCENDVAISFTAANQTVTQDFLIRSSIICPDLSVEATVPWVQACSQSIIYVDYCNDGTILAEDAYVEVTLDSFLSVDASSIPYSSISPDNVVTFDLGDIDPFVCGSFNLTVSLPCDGSANSSYGVDVHIFPDSICGPPIPGYSGAYVEAITICNTDSVGFTVKNIGVAAMDMTLDFFIVEDAVLLTEGDVPVLQPQQEISYILPVNGSTYTFIHEQVDMAPGLSVPIRIIEGCGVNGIGEYSTGFANQFSMGDEDGFLDIDRPVNLPVITPNTLMVSPQGYDEEHYIRPGSAIEYLLPFQNTGTEMVDKITIRDSVSADFDMTSLTGMTASHDFTFRMEGPQVMVFEFENLQLPPSSTDPLAAQGFLSFQLKHKADIPLGTLLTNDATIRFDDQAPMISDQVFHTLGENFIEVVVITSTHPTLKNIEVSVQPNPVSDFAVFNIKNHRAEVYQLEIFDLKGQLISSKTFINEQVTIRRDQLATGLYVYRLSSLDGLYHTGRLVVK